MNESSRTVRVITIALVAIVVLGLILSSLRFGL
jgi:hypothetical protein